MASNRKMNRQLRKAKIKTTVGTLNKRAVKSVDLRVQLKDLMDEGGGKAVDARRRYKALVAPMPGVPTSTKGYYNGNAAKGRKAVTDRSDLIEFYQAKYS